MANLPRYNPAENLRRILIDKNASYLLLEGEEDIPIYESIARSYLHTMKCTSDFIPIHGGGKEKVVEFAKNNSTTNFLAILDMDFDVTWEADDERIIVLGKYSIENYIYSPDTMIPFISNILSCGEREAAEWFAEKFDLWKEHVFTGASSMLKSLYYYQQHIDTGRYKWADSFILEDIGWRIDTTRVDSIISDLYDGNIPITDINDNFFTDDLNKNNILNYFPGKILIPSLYRFIKEHVDILSGISLGSIVSNCRSFFKYATSFLLRDREMTTVLQPMFLFIVG